MTTEITSLSGQPLYTQGACHDLNRPGETVDFGGDEIHARNLCFDYVINVDLGNADLRGIYLFNTTFAYVDFEGADFTGAWLGDTVFITCRNLDKAVGLDAVNHERPSVVDARTLALSGYDLPSAFLEGCGYSEEQVEILRAGGERETPETMEEALTDFLDTIDAIDARHGEVDDTAVREEVLDAVHNAYLDGEEAYYVDGKFGMFTAQGARLVRSAVRRFVDDANRIATAGVLASRRQRLDALVAAVDIRKDAKGDFSLETAGDYYAAWIAGLK